ncbi:MAG: ABC transporter substrate-binding protein [Synergistaceae bacterium]|jgi:putative ABC transport system substrate-binding protein|nr:ABC transporter substrate-binding protein [Synergistaceae bacterium]
MKKICVLLLATAAVIGLCAGSASADEKQVKIGLIQPVEHTSLNTIRENFIQQLRKIGYSEDRVAIDYRNAQGDRTKIKAVCQQFVSDKVDMIVAVATPAAQGAAAATSDIPIVFLAVSDPVKAGLLKNLEAPEGNITGTSDVVPVDQIFKLAGEITPNAKKFGFLYNAGEANSLTAIEKAKAYCDSNGLTYTEATVGSASEVQSAARSLADKVDAFFCPNDNTIASSMSVVSQVAAEAKIPVYVGAITMVIDGGLATAGVDSGEMGILGANLAGEMLSGKKISELPVVIVQKYNLMVNKKAADKLGLDVTAYKSVN